MTTGIVVDQNRIDWDNLYVDLRKQADKRSQALNGALRGVLIGLCGRAGVGKTATAEAICGLAENAIVKPMASPLKRLARDYFGWNGEKDERGRELLQHLGTDTGRAWDPDFWVKKWVSSTFDIWRLAPETGIIVDDVRFQNEVDAIHQLGGITVMITHDSRGYVLNHASESQVLDVTHVVNMGDRSSQDVAKIVLGLWGLVL